jgi:probable lipoprotein NlpC
LIRIFVLMALPAGLFSCVSTRSSRLQASDLVVQKARSYLGTPYRYGGTTSQGMDCSGLLIRSFEAVDLYLPRSTAEQSKLGAKVKPHQLQRGDLVFFATKKPRRKVSHAGLVTERDGHRGTVFIHASSSRGVIESSLTEEYYRRRFVIARRLKF